MIFKVKNKITEANIQAEFYHLCKKQGFNCYLEYTYDKCRFDAVMYNSKNEIYAIIEFKSYKTFKDPIISTKQIKRYKKYGIPIYMITRVENIQGILNKIIDKHIHQISELKI